MGRDRGRLRGPIWELLTDILFVITVLNVGVVVALLLAKRVVVLGPFSADISWKDVLPPLIQVGAALLLRTLRSKAGGWAEPATEHATPLGCFRNPHADQ